jgi:opacity protein-like surface antigen
VKQRLIASTFIVTAALLGALGEAEAQQPTLTLGNAYVGVSGGGIIPEDMDFNVAGGIVGSGQLTFKNGYAFTGYAGYHFVPWLAGELELGYSAFDLDKLTGTFTVPGVGTATGSAGLSGDVSTFFGFGNVILSPWTTPNWHPYFGGGIGFADTETKLNSVFVSGAGSVAVGSKQTEADFAANALAGLDYNFPGGIAIGARYRFVWVNTAATSSSGGITVHNGDLMAHVITANLSVRF